MMRPQLQRLYPNDGEARHIPSQSCLTNRRWRRPPAQCPSERTLIRIKRKLLPGQSGTKRLVKRYGEALVCVRYRYDTARNIAMKTVVLIIETRPWCKDSSKIPANKIVDIRVEYGETDLGRAVKAAGGKWNRERKPWRLSYKKAIDLDLSDRIVPGKDQDKQ